MGHNKFYDGTKLLSLKDLDGETPEIYVCTSNRSAGKTTFFSRYVVNRFLKYGEKFMLIYRWKYELADISDKFFKDISSLYFSGYEFETKSCAKGIFYNLCLNGKNCGYAVSLNSADNLKNYSHLFSDTTRMLFDEFQSENNHYCPNEVRKLQSLHTSVARGQGKQSRYVPVIMLSNLVDILNPYYIAWNVSDKLDTKTKFLRGHGIVVEQGFNVSAAEAIKNSAFNRAFAENDYKYSFEKIYLNNDLTFIDTLEGKSEYKLTFRISGKDYAIREYSELGFVYCDKRVDNSFPCKIVVDTPDMDVNYIMIRKNHFILSILKWYFENGLFRFKNSECKNAVFKLLSL